MFQTFIYEFQKMVLSTQQHIPFVLGFIGILVTIHIGNLVTGYRLNHLGLRPRSANGIIGIFCAPFLHGSFNHLFFNAVPLFILSCMVLIYGYFVFCAATILIILLSGVSIWLLGRPGRHIGASGLIMGYFGYLLAQAYFQITPITVILAIVAIYYFGGSAVLSIFPEKKGVSWEGHLLGLLSGMATAYMIPTVWVIWSQMIR